MREERLAKMETGPMIDGEGEVFTPIIIGRLEDPTHPIVSWP